MLLLLLIPLLLAIVYYSQEPKGMYGEGGEWTDHYNADGGFNKIVPQNQILRWFFNYRHNVELP